MHNIYICVCFYYRLLYKRSCNICVISTRGLRKVLVVRFLCGGRLGELVIPALTVPPAFRVRFPASSRAVLSQGPGNTHSHTAHGGLQIHRDSMP